MSGNHLAVVISMPAHKLLIIEDDASLAEAIGRKFTNIGFDVVYALEGRQGVQLVESEQPDVVLLDLMLPDVDGTDVCRHLRQRSAVPIIIVTARTDEAERVAGLEIGADDYVTKPFSLNELVARTRAVLRRTHGGMMEGGLGIEESVPEAAAAEVQAPESLSAAGVEIDVAAHRVTVNGQEVLLTPTEFRLLQTLLENAGKVVSHRQLLKAGWGVEMEDTHLVEVHIANLRSKIEDNPPNPQRVQTVRGFGYRLG